MKNYAPLILNEQERVIEWSREMQKNHISLSTIIEFLVSSNKPNSSIVTDRLLIEVREIYRSKNAAWREKLLKALVLDRYQMLNDIKEGQIVTNGSEVGFACNVDYTTRDFELSVKKDGTEILGLFEINDFEKV